MPSEIKSILREKQILILGFGKEGQSTYRHLRKWFPEMHLYISDRNHKINLEVADDSVTFYTGETYLDSCMDFDLIIKSPGIPYEMLEGKCNTSSISSQTDLFLRAYAKQVIGVTGTKGKSTTTSLIHHILNAAGHKALLAGNIGVPPLDLVGQIDENTEVVFEMSSHQLEQISLAPQIAVILNVFPEHLDHYKDFTAYKMAKFNISRNQPDGGVLVYNQDDKIIGELLNKPHTEKKLLPYSLQNREASAYFDGNDILCRDGLGNIFSFSLSEVNDLPGTHNMMNTMAAILVCLEKGILKDDIVAGLGTYKRLEHRLEYAGKFGGVHFYDDSIATIPEACIEALKTLDKVDLLILGGYDRHLDYSSLYNRLQEFPLPFVVFMGDAGQRMYKECQDYDIGSGNAFLVEDMERAFSIIKDQLDEGDVCLLSPAAASYGMFRNFEERGELFKKMAADQ
ncbi:MAG: UDP-N-acetylmuramoyl-L-alanine--D-glutamate ligase [Bacteroidetes bacterium]|nr:MAG: UDP-N-acetylmuramoyl-L-alanine--D-glutamate ligase [Bacteroidota bacterium]